MSTQLSAEWKKKIIDKSNDYVWEDNPEAVRSAYIDGATDYAELLVEAQGRIKTLEDGIKQVISTLNWIENGDEIGILRKALSPNSKQKEDEQ